MNETNVDEVRNYCLNCVNRPCKNNGCPLNNEIPVFIHEEDIEKAFEILSNTTVLPAICGSICPHEKQCQGSCIRGIKGEPVSIGKMEAFIGKKSLENNYKIPKIMDKNDISQEEKDLYESLKNKRVAVVGSGPAGLTCSAFLAKAGVKVTMYEKHDTLGGILTHGIPDFRLDREIIKSTIDKILDLGIDVKLNQQLGKDIKIEELTEEYDAVFIGIGANQPTTMGIEGENLKGVYGGNTLLENNEHPNYKNKIVCVIGGGNVAMDTSRTIKKLGAKDIYVIYRRAEEQMPAEKKEIQDAKSEGIKFLFQTNIVRIIKRDSNNCNDNKVDTEIEQIECIKTELVQKEGETRLSPVNIEGSNFMLDMDYVVMATGSKPNEEDITEFEKNKWGYINVNDNMETSIQNVFAGGDIVGEKSTVAWAARSGRNAAESIIKRLSKSVDIIQNM